MTMDGMEGDYGWGVGLARCRCVWVKVGKGSGAIFAVVFADFSCFLLFCTYMPFFLLGGMNPTDWYDLFGNMRIGLGDVWTCNVLFFDLILVR